MRSTALMIIIAHTFVILSPAAAAVRDEIGKKKPTETSIEAELSTSYTEAIKKLALLKQLHKENKEADPLIGDLITLKTRIEMLDQKIMESFENEKQSLINKQLPEEIVNRHNKMVTAYKQKSEVFQELLNKETDSGLITNIWRQISNYFNDNKQTTTDAFPKDIIRYKGIDFKATDFRRSQQDFDPNNLGTNSLQPDKNNIPKTTRQEYYQSGLKDSPAIKLTALGDFQFDSLEGADNPLYLATSDEVQLTQSIKDKAAELEYDAVKIYHWVRNNIEWLPSWGAIQDAELTLEAQRGNSMDIASLTISLLRASQIPARYVHGTIDVDPEHFKNWAGNFTTAEAAGDYASSGGIPITSMTTNLANGQVRKTMRMEHVWVEAATDFQPSRGGINLEADTWVQLDPSFKQYEYQEGLDVVAISGLDLDQLESNLIASGMVNKTEGWATGFDPGILQQAFEETEVKLRAHINALDNPTIGDVIGGKKTIIKEYPVLPSSLPNPVVIIGTRYDKLPGALQQKIEFAFNKDILGDLIDPISYPFAKLNNEKVSLSFKPATETDEQALQALIPDGITDVSELPTSIPSTIRVLPELKVDGVTVKTGPNMAIGEELPFITGILFAGRGYIRTPRTYKVIAGSYLNVNVFAGSVSPVKLEKLQQKLESTKTILESSDQAQIAAITRHDVYGDIFYAGSLSYFSQLLSNSYLSGLKAKSYYQMAAGYGTIGYEPEVNSFFGVPRSIKTGGVAFDIPLMNVTANSAGDPEKARQYTLEVGIISSGLEHDIPEQMFISTEPNIEKPDAISAVKALQKANTSGQRIYTINQMNMEHALPLLQHDTESINEIISALNAGKEVTTHTDAVSIPGGWTGFGYIITDPVVGDGVYKISGGANGGHKGRNRGGMFIGTAVENKLSNYDALTTMNVINCIMKDVQDLVADLVGIGIAWKDAKKPDSQIKRLAYSLRGIFTRASLTYTIFAVLIILLLFIVSKIAGCIADSIGLRIINKKFRSV